MSIAPSERPAEVEPLVSPQDLRTRGETTPLYIVCSPSRGVGKTLLSRLLIEFHDLEDRPVAVFDLADEGPQLADFMPDRATVADISDIFGQMALFDSLISDSNAIKVIDLGHRIFRSFFVIAQKIGFFEEVRRHAIEPAFLFIVDPGPKSAEAYSTLQRWFNDVPLMPVRNHAVTKGMPCREAYPNGGGVPVSPEIPVLSPSLKALVEQQSFSFAQFWRKALHRFPARLDDELRPWTKRVFLQFRQIDGCLIGEDIQGGSVPANIGRTVPSPTDAAFVAKLQQAVSLSNQNCNRATALAYTLSAELRDAQQRVNQLEREAALIQAEGRNEQLNAEAAAHIERIKREADEHAARAEADTDECLVRAWTQIEENFTRLKRELAVARQRADRAKAVADEQIEEVRREAHERVRAASDRVSRLEAGLAEARQRAERAEHWILRIHEEIKGHLDFTHERLSASDRSCEGSMVSPARLSIAQQ